MNSYLYRTRKHEQWRCQSSEHCWVHQVDEPAPAYLVCGECNHAYQTASELKQAHIDTWTAIDNSFGFWQVWRVRVRPASKIIHCPHCSHTF